MKQDIFGKVMYEGKMVDIDKTNMEALKKISEELKEKNQKLEEKAENIFNQ